PAEGVLRLGRAARRRPHPARRVPQPDRRAPEALRGDGAQPRPRRAAALADRAAARHRARPRHAGVGRRVRGPPSGGDLMRRAAIAGLALLAAGCGGGGGGTTAGRPAARVDGCIAVGTDSRSVTLHVQRALTANAVILGTGPRAVVLANQSDRNLCSWKPLA